MRNDNSIFATLFSDAFPLVIDPSTVAGVGLIFLLYPNGGGELVRMLNFIFHLARLRLAPAAARKTVLQVLRPLSRSACGSTENINKSNYDQ